MQIDASFIVHVACDRYILHWRAVFGAWNSNSLSRLQPFSNSFPHFGDHLAPLEKTEIIRLTVQIIFGISPKKAFRSLTVVVLRKCKNFI